MMQWFNLIYDWFYGLYALGGEILFVIILVALVMWALIIERYLYFAFSRKHTEAQYAQLWETIEDKTIAERRMLKSYYLSEYQIQSERGIIWIQQFIKVSLLLGLLGTVFGLISVFESQQLFATSVSAMHISSSIAHTIIPTTAGLLVSLSGLFFANHLHNLAHQATTRLDHLLY